MCICVNCKHMKNCKTYFFIQKQHKKILKKLQPINFIPSSTMIEINIQSDKYKKIKLDWDLVECASFVEKPGYWLYVNKI